MKPAGRNLKGRRPDTRTHVEQAESNDWMTPREAALYLHVGVDAIYEACAAGGLKHVRLGYRTIRVRRRWIDEWAEEKVRQFS
jgi:excisionase family DNA binding protein